MAEDRKYLSVLEVAEMLGLHEESVRKLVREGRLPAFKAGRSWRFDQEELIAWRKRQRASGTGSRILVVDDDEDIREVIRITLEEAGHTVIQAATGEGAKAALSRPSGSGAAGSQDAAW